MMFYFGAVMPQYMIETQPFLSRFQVNVVNYLKSRKNYFWHDLCKIISELTAFENLYVLL